MKKIYIFVALTVMLMAAPLTEEKALELFESIKQSEYSWVVAQWDNEMKIKTQSRSSRRKSLWDDNDSDRKSAFLLGYYYKTEKYNSIDMLASHNNYLKAANWGDEEAKMIVAWNFYKGKGCDKNIAQSKEMLTQLSIAGNAKAKEVLKFVIRN